MSVSVFVRPLLLFAMWVSGLTVGFTVGRVNGQAQMLPALERCVDALEFHAEQWRVLGRDVARTKR